MTSPIASIALFTPVVASNAIFSFRRVSRGVEAIDENPMYAAMNMDIAAAQVTKGARAAKALSIVADNGSKEALELASNITNGAAEKFKATSEVSKTAKVLKGAQKVINFTADNINPVICVASGIKVLGSEDKVDEGARESIRLGTMFGAEALAKRAVGMPYTKKINGKNVTFKREGLGEKFYKEVFSTKQKEAIEQAVKTKAVLKYLPSTAKGLLFVGASIGGYKLGNEIADRVLGPKKQTA